MTMPAMETVVRSFFRRYQALHEAARNGAADMDAIAACYSSEVIGASPLGVRAAKNDQELKDALEKGAAHYRALGAAAMTVEGVTVVPIDELHCLARVAWRSVFRRDGRPDVVIDFENAYLLQILDGEPKIFGWITGDEQGVLRAHGIG